MPSAWTTPRLICFDQDDVAWAKQRLAEGMEAVPLALTPITRAAFQSADIGHLAPTLDYHDRAHALSVRRIARGRRRLFKALQEAQAGLALREAFRQEYDRSATAATRLWHALGDEGPWIIPDHQDGRPVADKETAHAATLERMVAKRLPTQLTEATPPPVALPRLYRLLRHLALASVSVRRPVLATSNKSSFALLGVLSKAAEAPAVLIQRPPSGFGAYGRLLRSWLAHQRKTGSLRVCYMTSSTDRESTSRELVTDWLKSIDDPVLERALFPQTELLAAITRHLWGAADDVAGLVAQARPRLFASPEISCSEDWLVAEACGMRGVERVCLVRNAQEPADSLIAQDATAGYFLSRQPDGLCDRFIFWQPGGTATARQVLPGLDESRIYPVRLPPPAVAKPRPERRRRKVLQVASYSAWWYRLAWLNETSDEFCAGLAELGEAMADVPDAELLYRLKFKPEGPLDSIRTLVPGREGHEMRIRDRPYSQDLEDADLVVGHRSTALNEALEAGVPVLLWGGTRRAPYFPAARVTLPTPEDRAAVYRVVRKEDLAPMITAILDAHAGRPLTDNERQGLVFGPETEDLNQVARRILSDIA